MKNPEGPINERGLPADLTAFTGRARRGRASRFGADAKAGQAEVEEILAWGPDEDQVVSHRAGRADFVLRALTALAAAASVVFVAIGLGDDRPQRANETIVGRPITPVPEAGTQIGPSLPPSCLVDWPDQRHLPCPQQVPNPSGSAEDNCLHPPFTHPSRVWPIGAPSRAATMTGRR